MTTEQWTTSLSAIATLLAVIIAGISVYIARIQTVYQFRPRLRVRSKVFQISSSNASIAYFAWQAPSSEVKYIDGGETDYHLDIINSGNGVALDVKLRFEYKHEKVIKEMRRLLKTSGKDIEIKKDNYGYAVFVDQRAVGGFKRPDQLFRYHDAIYTVASDEAPTRTQLDSTLEFLCLCYSHHLMFQKVVNDIQLDPIRIPTKLSISCEDGIGKRHKYSQHAILTISGGQWKSDLSQGVTLVSLSTKKIKFWQFR